MSNSCQSYTNINESMFKLNIDQQFNEPINIDKAKKLIRLPDYKFKSLIWVDNNNNDNGEFWKPESYIYCCKKFLRHVINNNGINTNKYKYSTKLIDCGRMYIGTDLKFGVQSLQKQLRGYLTSDTLIDFDMVNAHPTILLYICKRFYNNYDWDELTKYVKCRKWYLNKHKIDKTTILIMMNSNKLSTKLNIDVEFKRIQDFLYNNTPECLDFMNKYKTDKQNPKGKFLNKILCIFENMILHSAISKMPTDSVKVKMFDGFMADTSVNVSDTIINLNDATKEYGIKWSVKEPDLSIEDQINDDDLEPSKDYESVKTEFEKTYFMVTNPVVFGEEKIKNGQKEVVLHSIQNFRSVVAKYKYIEHDKTKQIFNKWLEDETRREYSKLDFIPNCQNTDNDIYNTFTGLPFYDKPYKHNDNIIDAFTKHISILTNHEQSSINYVNLYIAHMIQKTEEIPRTAILFKSDEGYGKDLFIDFLARMLGTRHLHRTQKIDDVFGTFNSCLKDKILLQVNELEGKNGFQNKEAFKDIITGESFTINQKNVCQYTQKNYLRLFITSNNLNPIEISHSDRRYAVFQAHPLKPKKEYFNELVDLCKDDNAIATLYNYYKNYDISNFDTELDRPKTQAYQNMKDNNIDPIYYYLKDQFVDGEYEIDFEDQFKTHKSTGNILIQPNNLLREYKSWLSKNNYKTDNVNFKSLKNKLSHIGVNRKSFKHQGDKVLFYAFDLDLINQKIAQLDIGESLDDLEELE